MKLRLIFYLFLFSVCTACTTKKNKTPEISEVSVAYISEYEEALIDDYYNNYAIVQKYIHFSKDDKLYIIHSDKFRDSLFQVIIPPEKIHRMKNEFAKLANPFDSLPEKWGRGCFYPQFVLVRNEREEQFYITQLFGDYRSISAMLGRILTKRKKFISTEPSCALVKDMYFFNGIIRRLSYNSGYDKLIGTKEFVSVTP